MSAPRRTYLAPPRALPTLPPAPARFHDAPPFSYLRYTPPASLYNIFLETVLPFMAFVFNVVFLVTVRRSLRREMPFSVRTRTRRQMFNYVVVWVFCYGPYIANALYSSVARDKANKKAEG